MWKCVIVFLLVLTIAIVGNMGLYYMKKLQSSATVAVEQPDYWSEGKWVTNIEPSSNNIPLNLPDSDPQIMPNSRQDVPQGAKKIEEPSIVRPSMNKSPFPFTSKASAINGDSPVMTFSAPTEILNRAQAHTGIYYRSRYADYFKENVHQGIWKDVEYILFEPSWKHNILPDFAVLRNVKIRNSKLLLQRNFLDHSSLPKWIWQRLKTVGGPGLEICENKQGDVLQFALKRCRKWPHDAECPVYSYSMALHATFFTQRDSTRTWWVDTIPDSHWSKRMSEVVEMITGDQTKYATHVRFGMPEEACVDILMYSYEYTPWNGESFPWALAPEDIYRMRESLHQLPETTSSIFKGSNELSEVDIELRAINRKGYREVINAKETMEFTKKYFERHGKTVHFLEAFMDNLSISDQWESLKDADIVVSSHGAQEINMVAARKCTAWLEIFPIGYYVPSYYGSMCEQYGMLYYYYYDRDAKAGKPKCMLQDPSLDPDTPGVPLIPGGYKENFPRRVCRRRSKIRVDLEFLEPLLGDMLIDHKRCLADDGRLPRRTDFFKLVSVFKELYAKDKRSPNILHMSVKNFSLPVDYIH